MIEKSPLSWVYDSIGGHESVKRAPVISQVIRVKGDGIVNYCYLLICKETGASVLVDPAWDMEKISKILELRQTTPVAILLTHHHKDHTNLADVIAKKFDIDVFMSSAEIEHYQFACHNLLPIEEGVFEIGGMSICVIETAGHTVGSLCYKVGSNLYTGDTLFIEGCGVCRGNGSSADRLYESLSLLKHTTAASTRVFPGHRFQRPPGLKMKDVLEINPYLSLESRDEFVRVHCRKRDMSKIQYL